MSWDVFIQHLPASAVRVADVPDDFEPLPLGSQAEVLEAIRRVFPTVSTPEATWAVVEDPHYRIEFGLGADDPITSIQLHVRGDETVVQGIDQLIHALGARGIDSWTGEFFDPETARESVGRWNQFLEEL
ncbi:MAG TPA: hypothetical protein VGF48_13725 [Thermoanaerobaculia bacterium]